MTKIAIIRIKLFGSGIFIIDKTVQLDDADVTLLFSKKN